MDSYTVGYSIGFDDGKNFGYTKGYQDAEQDLEPRLGKYWAELQTLNARVDYLTKVLNGENND